MDGEYDSKCRVYDVEHEERLSEIQCGLNVLCELPPKVDFVSW